ncbi:MAG: (Dimethylallyl)adenosine tRNA methylthiotransferase MiaB [Candidatus Curtissbacteria bacterium GW2011_GWA1_40_47]|uniref:Uncharacterized protein n=1 Tax=Candidatus Curtissbacteria bacterium RIFOXYA1_FULL_41_14 TaxID=1797737 RepID=A0A1F5HC11_9BACT|nr:MAG: (Dimethylallyl)adenosine tRNA methylthiotransferase MiaB [Candidatus Curtissbacteria bacterium GW2011_GWB1_40_28]KKR60859.1 MAG: (Dimethylallyl)adenosine tRNA methylthiotransferase MiaB [Candidatus Curtissbacteria bacterium GW2011_GWA2_40_31]KKR62167.1 MAG: (Dimethylallyl)adenosine tRNA methylthiotransferase MiaB [Microgenomates group bacterium GW2011_GWC1_40_35]KKR66042.1 MAG: (Dimethylallyl)adenosine tRNA methylthiotransferase MiaB [Candidatus Curtissbacteria bacterium GW2011_GWA1_40_4
MKSPTFYIKTFGCQQNWADSQRIASYYLARGFKRAKDLKSASEIIINTCMVRQSAEDKVTGFIRNIIKEAHRAGGPRSESETSLRRRPGRRPKIVLTGCMTGMVARDTSGKYLNTLHKRIPQVDEFLPLEEVGFNYPALRSDATHAWIPISNGCNNFCTYCVVPFTRGQEVSRPFEDVIDEVKELAERGCREITLLGQNVNSYGSDRVKNTKAGYKLPNGRVVKPVMVKHLGKLRIPTLFPYLLEEVCKIEACPSKSGKAGRSGGVETVKFISSNPWDFSDELIETISKNPKIDRNIHLPVQSGDDQMLKKMNRWYTASQYINLVKKIRKEIPDTQISTDIIVGFCQESERNFQNTVKLAQTVNFAYAYIAKYSPRPNTAAAKAFDDDVSYKEKQRRFQILDKLINHKGNPRSAVH